MGLSGGPSCQPYPHLFRISDPLPSLPFRPNHRNLRVGWVHTQKDLTIEPSYNLGSESLSAEVTYRLDAENRLKVRGEGASVRLPLPQLGPAVSA